MNVIKFLMIILVAFLITSCGINSKLSSKNKLRNMRTDLYYGLTDEQKKDRAFYHSLVRYEFNMKAIKDWLKEGRNPNYCFGECGWKDSNPRLLLSQFHYDTFFKSINGETIPDPTPDDELLDILIENGADISLYPYVFIKVITYDKKTQMSDNVKLGYIKDSNRFLKALLDKGADPNAKGNLKAFDWQTYDENLSYENFIKLCTEPDATTPLYEAIKKGIDWESQVDLLLEYGAILDETCLEAANLSGDDRMIEKIKKLFKTKHVSKISD